MTASLEVGDRVSWNTPQGRKRGRVVARNTTDFELAGQHFKASKDHPKFVVESDKTGKRAAHTDSALRKLQS